MEAVIAHLQSLKSGQDIKKQRLELPEGILGRGNRMSNKAHKGGKAQIILIGHLCAWHCSKGFTRINSFSSHTNPMKYILVLALLYR